MENGQYWRRRCRRRRLHHCRHWRSLLTFPWPFNNRYLFDFESCTDVPIAFKNEIFCMLALRERLDAHRFRLTVNVKWTAQAGTYIKEFVHGDLGWTQPSMATLLGCKRSVLALECEGIEMENMEDNADFEANNGRWACLTIEQFWFYRCSSLHLQSTNGALHKHHPWALVPNHPFLACYLFVDVPGTLLSLMALWLGRIPKKIIRFEKRTQKLSLSWGWQRRWQRRQRR